jgi:bifunctional DNA-binding transcriptional regulator/antitoxin component of YhaV-PrlF toxin-antitoxin module
MTLTSVEFDARVGDQGEILIPDHIREKQGLAAGSPLRVRITDRALSARLSERGVNEEEIQSISDLQIESRENVVAFLLAEGAFSATRKTRARR